jgi:hypothetical protein
MATMYNKTALNKIKKADLIALFLEQQAEKNQLVLDSEENEKLKEENKKLNQLNDYAYKQMNELMSKVTLLTDEIEKLKEESDSESDEECDQCVCCEVKFDQHEARYNMGEDLRLKYQKYFGSEKDDGDICPECLNLISD